MPNRLYLRRIDDHCVEKEISFTVEVHKKVFLNQDSFHIIGKKSKKEADLTVAKKKDRRFNGKIKSVIKAELGGRSLSSGDILVFRSAGDAKYIVEMITSTDSDYSHFDEMCSGDIHTIICSSSSSVPEGIEVRQLIKYGVPGTGKSYGITQKIKEIYESYEESGDSEFVFRTTLHPEYSYFDFVGSVFPVVEGTNINYKFRPGIFTLALEKALTCKDDGNIVFLVLEEMSRANVSAVFGDLFQLLDRNDSGDSEYKIRNDLVANYIRENSKFDLLNNCIYLPSNLYIYGTVNTSDQNVFVMDNAFKRRFEFEYVGTQPVYDGAHNPLNEYEFELDSITYKWSDFYRRLNYYATSIMGLKEDKQIGPFFLKFKDGSSDPNIDKYNYNQIMNKLLQYLWQDVHKCAMAEKPLFRKEITTFEDAYFKLEDHKNIFCDEFCDFLNVEESETSDGTDGDSTEVEEIDVDEVEGSEDQSKDDEVADI